MTSTTFKIIKKNNKFWVRMQGGEYFEDIDMMIYKVNTDSPYIRYGGHFIGKVPLTPEMIKELRILQSA